MLTDDAARVAAVLATLTPADAAALARYIADAQASPPAPWQRRQARLNARDTAIRTAMAVLGPDLSVKERAKRLAGALIRHIGSRGRAPASVDMWHPLLCEIIDWNGGAPLGQRQLESIWGGRRGR